MIEYWVPSDPFKLPKTIDWEYKSDTSLYEFKKVNLQGCPNKQCFDLSAYVEQKRP
jgi:peptidylprolyl isomerase domain and WD repeat-containing protein 1